MRKEDSQTEVIIAGLLLHRFHRERIEYEKVSLGHDGHHTVPDFNVHLDDRTLLIEVTSAPLTILFDPKKRQRKIMHEETLDKTDYSWMILYWQHCVTADGLAIASASLDLLVESVPSVEVQAHLDSYALSCQKCPKIHTVDWNRLRKEVFKSTDAPRVDFW